MSRRFQAVATMLLGAGIAALGFTVSLAGCCGGIPKSLGRSGAAFGLAIAAVGVWSFLAREERPGIARRNPLWIALLSIAIATALLAVEVYGLR